jgi:replication-associated recombination protein RarA
MGVPDHLKDSHYPGAKKLGRGEGYVYTHDHPEVEQEFLKKGTFPASLPMPRNGACGAPFRITL